MVESLFIRPIEVADAQLVLNWENNVEGWNMSETPVLYTFFDILNLINELQNVQTAKQARWMICTPDLHEPIGVVDLTDIDFEVGVSGVGVMIADPAHRRKGMASKALDLLEVEAKKLKIHTLLSTILEDNAGSIRLFEKIGYKKIGATEEKYFVQGTYIQGLLFEKWLNAL